MSAAPPPHGAHPAGEPVPGGCGPACFASRWKEGWTLPLPALDDAEGERLDKDLPEVIDAHVHLFPDRLFEAIWSWFDQHGWPIRYKLKTPEVVRFQLQRGVSRIVALHYAHKPGLARGMNRYLAELAAAEPRVVGVATVLPGEEGARAILEEAFELGLRGVKLHCHVQRFAPDQDHLHELYALCQERGMPLVMHAGREPASPAYPVDPYLLCAAERVEAVLRAFPRLKLCVPHLGADEFEPYGRLLERHDNLYLDTTMAVAGYFPGPIPWSLVERRPERVLFGTDFPNLPYAWDREIRNMAGRLKGDGLAQVLARTARGLFGI